MTGGLTLSRSLMKGSIPPKEKCFSNPVQGKLSPSFHISSMTENTIASATSVNLHTLGCKSEINSLQSEEAMENYQKSPWKGLFCMALALYRRNKHSFKNVSLYLYQFLIQLYNTSYKYYKYPLEYRHLLLMGL